MSKYNLILHDIINTPYKNEKFYKRLVSINVSIFGTCWEFTNSQ